MKNSSPSSLKAERSSSRYQRIRAVRYDSKLGDGELVDISLSIDRKMIGRGTFAVVYQSYVRETGETVAVKEVVVDRTHKNRELEILLELNHPNIIKLKYSFLKEETHVRQRKVQILCLVMEIFPETVYSLVKRWHEKLNESVVDSKQVKLFTFQMFRALTYLHARGIAHRDIKPTNLLVNTQTGLLKICDFGAAKHLLPNDISVAYICSRYYRAPELILGCTSYTTSVDIWAAACVVTEFYSGVPLFKGVDQNDQLLRIFLLLGEPNSDELRDMKPKSDSIILQSVQQQLSVSADHKTLVQHLASITRSDYRCAQFCSRLLQYSPHRRLTALHALTDEYYEQIHREQSLKGLFEFDPTELNLFRSISDSSFFKSVIDENKSFQQSTQRKKDLPLSISANRVSSETQIIE